MTIRKGEPWGTTGPAPDDLVIAASDAELARIVVEHRSAATPVPPVALLGGNLMRSVGGTGRRDRLDGPVAIMPIDIVRVEADGVGDAGALTGWFVNHLVAKRSWWRSPCWIAMNGQYIGDRDVAPRAHPNDGRVDVVRVDASMSIRDRWRASRRAVHGLHVPHPAIEIRQVASTVLDLGAPTAIELDGTRWSEVSTLTLTVEPDAVLVVV